MAAKHELQPYTRQCAKCGDWVYHETGTKYGRKWVRDNKSLYGQDYINFNCSCGYSWDCATFDACKGPEKKGRK